MGLMSEALKFCDLSFRLDRAQSSACVKTSTPLVNLDSTSESSVCLQHHLPIRPHLINWIPETAVESLHVVGAQ